MSVNGQKIVSLCYSSEFKKQPLPFLASFVIFIWHGKRVLKKPGRFSPLVREGYMNSSNNKKLSLPSS